MDSTTGGKAAGTRAVGDVATRSELGELLTEVRARSGRSVRELARTVGIGSSTVSDWCRARTLPFPNQDATFARLLEEMGVDDTEPWLAALRRVRGRPRRARRDGPAPYRGLDSFRAEDRAAFFGRDELVELVHKRFRRVLEHGDTPRLLFVVGASGSGKSSVLHAGLVPRLEDDGHAVVSLTPGAHPADALAAALDTDGAASGRAGLVVVVDQFEEVFTACADPSARAAFLDGLTGLASGPAPFGAVVVGLRIDFYPALAAGPWAVALQDAQVLVGPMSRDELTAAIVEPARAAGTTVDDALVDVILREFVPAGSVDGRHDPGALPLLSHALLETWHNAGRGRMTVDDYRAAGGIRRAIEDSAERAYGELTDPGRAAARRMFLRLVNVEADGVATRRRATHDELAGLDGDAAAVLAPFIDARLVTAHESTVEIAHEALLAAWPRLRTWIDDDREGIRVRRRIGDATQVWLDHDRDPSALATGARLEAMQQWADGDAEHDLSRDERAFLDASAARAAERARARRRRTQRLRLLAGAATVLAVLAASLAVVARDQRSDAVTARDRALSRELAVSASALRDVDPSVAAHLALRGYQESPTAQARAELFETADLPFTTRYTGDAGPTAVTASPGDGIVATGNSVEGTVQLFTQADGRLDRRGAIDLGDDGVVAYALALTPDDTVLAVGDTTAAVNLWDVADPDRPRHLAGPLTGLAGPVQHLALTPDGTELAASGEGDGIVRWDISDPSSPDPLPTIPNVAENLGLAYSPDGTHVAFGDDLGTVHVWRLGRTPREVATLPAGEGSVYAVAFSPDGTTLAAGSQDGEARAWRLAGANGPGDPGGPGEPEEITLPDGSFDTWVNAVAFSPDGRRLVAGSSDGGVRVWVDDGGEWATAGTLPHPDAVTQVSFTGDGATLVTAAVDGATRLWDLAAVLPATADSTVWSLVFSDDGTRLAALAGGVSSVWDVSDPDRPVRLGEVVSPDPEEPFSGAGDMTRDGDLLVQGGKAGTVHLVDVSDPAGPRFVGGPLGGSSELVEQASFSTDGTLVAAAGDDGTVRIWDIRDPDHPRRTATLDDSGGAIMLNVVWSPTAPLLSANSADGYTYLYDLSDPDEPRLVSTLDRFDSESYASAFTAEGRTLAVGGTDRTVILWDVSDPADPGRIGDPITGPPSRIYDLAFAPDGTSLAAAVVNGTTWVWDTSDLRDPVRTAVLGPFDGPAFTVALSPDGSTLAAGGSDQQIHLWPTDEAATTASVCARLGDPLTEDEWSTHMPDEPYEPVC